MADVELDQCEEVGDDALDALAAHCRALERLSLAFCAVTDAGVLALRGRLPECTLWGLNDCSGVSSGYQRKCLDILLSHHKELRLGGQHFPTIFAYA